MEEHEVLVGRSAAPAVDLVNEVGDGRREVHAWQAPLESEADEHGGRALAVGLAEKVCVGVRLGGRRVRAGEHEVPQLGLAPREPRLERLGRAGRDAHLQVVLIASEEVRRLEKRLPELGGILRRRPGAARRRRWRQKPPHHLASARDLCRDARALRVADVVGRVHGRVGRRNDGHEVPAVLRVHLRVPHDVLRCLCDGRRLARAWRGRLEHVGTEGRAVRERREHERVRPAPDAEDLEEFRHNGRRRRRRVALADEGHEDGDVDAAEKAIDVTVDSTHARPVLERAQRRAKALCLRHEPKNHLRVARPVQAAHTLLVEVR
mmetsp:Transcript_3360/g.9822  ORF Transcript_3360/g.9822 Transcript_3360/m.9822 type:complete len:321 (-) Transcript_3360:699-1661(-)